MKAYRFEFAGGNHKIYPESPKQQTHKFFLFSILTQRENEAQEVIFFEAIKRGIIIRRPTPKSLNSYICYAPEVKLFLSSSGFGLRKMYYNLFFKFDSACQRKVTIKSFNYNESSYFFKAKGRFMLQEEIRDRYGENSPTYQYYLKQPYLSRSELKEIIQIEPDKCEASRVRVIRV